MLNEELVSNNEFYGMCVKELQHEHSNDQSLKMEMDEMRVREAELVKKISDLEITINILEEYLHHIYGKINWMYQHMNTLTAVGWKTEGKREEYGLMIESIHHVTSQTKEEKEKQTADTRDRKR